MSAIPADEFLDKLEKANERLLMNVVQAIQGIQVSVPPQQAPIVNIPPQPVQEAPVVNIPPQPAPVVNIDLQSVVASIENLTNRMITPVMIRTISEQLDQLGMLSDIENQRVIQSLQQIQNQVATPQDIENVVDLLVDVNQRLQGVEDSITTGLLQISNTNQLSYYIQDPEFFEPLVAGQPRVPLSKDKIIDVLTKRGLISFDNEVNRKQITEMSREELIQLGAVRNMIQEQAKAIYEYKTNQERLIEKDYRRAGFDMFSKDGEKTKQGTPLSKEVKFIYSKIPNVVIKFKNGKYEAFQNGKSVSFKNFRDADRFANKGGFLSEELQLLRNIEKSYFKKEEPLQVYFKAMKQ